MLLLRTKHNTMLCNSAAGSWPAYARTRDGKTPLVSAYYVYYTIYSRLCMVYAHGWIKEPLLMTGFSSRLLLCGQRDRIIDRLFDDSMCVVFSFIFFFSFRPTYYLFESYPSLISVILFYFPATLRGHHSTAVRNNTCIYI